MKRLTSFFIVAFLGIYLVACGEPYKEQNVLIQIVADTGIVIAIGDIDASPKSLNWVTTITNQEASKYVTKKYDLFKFNIVTSPNGFEFYNLGVSNNTVTTQGFLEIPIHFKSNTVSEINLSNLLLEGTPNTWNSPISFTTAKGQLISANGDFSIDISNATRISIQGSDLLNTYEKPETLTNTVLGGRLNVDLSLMNGVYDYYLNSNATDMPGSKGVTVVDSMNTILEHKILSLDSNQRESSGSEFYGKITIRIWLEAYDPDSYNSILDQVLKVSLVFSGN